MTIWQKIIVGTITGILWLGAIIAKHFFGDIDISLFVASCAGVIGALGIHGMVSPTTALITGPFVSGTLSSTGKEGGFASLRLLAILAAIALGLSLLGGCTTTTASMYAGLATQAEAGIKVFDDNSLATVRTVLCAQPYSAIQRHPELQPGIQAMCGPLANTASLDANQLALLMSVLQGSGVKLQAAPAGSPAPGAK